MNAQDIAEVAHEVNKAYCGVLGDTSQLSWENSPLWQAISVIKGVEAILKNPELSPEESHAKWLAWKVQNGWRYGEVKDPELKTHPCVMPFHDLPESYKVKDYIFGAVVRALRKYVPMPVPPAPPEQSPPDPGQAVAEDNGKAEETSDAVTENAE